jgi:DNA-binding PadR family transcriptional regulator
LAPGAIAQRLQAMSRNVVWVQQGSLYPALHRLENRGLLAAEWRLTDAVAAILAAKAEAP